jgi:hypothetical protein
MHKIDILRRKMKEKTQPTVVCVILLKYFPGMPDSFLILTETSVISNFQKIKKDKRTYAKINRRLFYGIGTDR